MAVVPAVLEALADLEARGGNSGGNSGPRGGGNSRGGAAAVADARRFSNEDYREVARQPREPRW